MTIQIGDKVRVKDKGWQRYLEDHYGTYEGFVMNIDKWESSGFLTSENHGTISIEFHGVCETFSYYGWEKELKILENDL